MELDLTEAIEAGRAASFAAYEARTGVFPANRSTQTEHYVAVYAEAAVRAAAPIIERAVLYKITEYDGNALDLPVGGAVVNMRRHGRDVSFAVTGRDVVALTADQAEDIGRALLAAAVLARQESS